MIKALLLLAAILGCALAAPAAPNIPGTFYAKIHIDEGEGRNYWRGGGILAFDVPAGRARIDVTLDGNAGPRPVHILNRYDLNETFFLEEGKCDKQKTTGSLENPFAWVAQATFAGTSTYQGVPLDDWTYTTSAGVSLRLSVLQSNPNVPVFYAEKYNNGSVIQTSEITYLEFNASTPEDWVFYIPQICKDSSALVGGDVNSVVYFANNNWDCADVSCSSRVAAGSGQPGYACAEFVARSLAYGGYFPGLPWNAAQGTFGNWKGYDLLYTTHLADALAAIAGFHKVAATGGSVNPACALFGNGGDGSWSHTCVGVANAVVDCHNNARYHISASGDMYLGIDAVYCP